jgi:hypothetical protein
MSDLTVVTFKLAVGNILILVNGNLHEFGLFHCVEDDEDDRGVPHSHLGGDVKASQSKGRITVLLESIDRLNSMNVNRDEGWQCGDGEHLASLVKRLGLFLTLPFLPPISTLVPVSCDGRFHVSRWGGNFPLSARPYLSVVPLHHVPLIGTLFLLVRMTSPFPTA